MRIRIKFSKMEAMRFTGHLDLHLAWERTFRRAKLPLSYSQGFHPKPRLNLACALPLGFTSQCELIDAWLEKDLPVDQVEKDLISSLPPGIQIHSLSLVPSPPPGVRQAPSLQSIVRAAEYVITLLEPCPDLNTHLQELLSTANLLRQRRGKEYNLRPLIESIELALPDAEGYPRLVTRLAAREGATGRPEELLLALGCDPEMTRIHRTALLVEANNLAEGC
jgi:radical SAM-linked protein